VSRILSVGARDGGGSGDLQTDAVFFRQRFVEFDQRLRLRLEPHRLCGSWQQAVVRLGQEEHVADYPRQAIELFEVRMQRLAVFVGAATPRQRDLGLGHQVGNRSAQSVRDVGGELAQSLGGCLQPVDFPIPAILPTVPGRNRNALTKM